MLAKKVELYNKFFNEINKGWAIITSGDKFIGSNSMTISWGGIGYLWEKNVCFIFVRESRYTKEFLDKSDSITVSFMNEKYKKEMTFFGRNSGRNVDKFKECNFHKTFDVDFNGYYVRESDYVLKLKKICSLDIKKENLNETILKDFYPNGDYHTLYICEIKQYLVNEDL